MKETRFSNSALKSVCKSCSKKPCDDLHWKDVVVCTDYFAAPIECPLKITDEHSIRFAFNRFSDYEVSVLAGSVWTQHNFGSRRNSGTNGKAEGINHIIAHMRQNKCVVLSKLAAPGYQPWVLLGGWGNTSFDGLFFSNETGPVKEEAALTDDLEVVSGPVTITNPRWKHTDKIMLEHSPDIAMFGDTVILMADVTGVPEGALVMFDIYDTSDTPPMVIDSARGRNEKGVANGTWKVSDKSGKGAEAKLEFEGCVKSKLSGRCEIPLKVLAIGGVDLSFENQNGKMLDGVEVKINSDDGTEIFSGAAGSGGIEISNIPFGVLSAQCTFDDVTIMKDLHWDFGEPPYTKEIIQFSTATDTGEES